MIVTEDKRTWGTGPWQIELDRLEWRHSSGLPCLIKRNMRYGMWCGYVAVPPGHSAYGQDYDNIAVDVHGGLTYGSLCDGDEGSGICHVPLAGEPAEVFWLGFDCHHPFDIAPAFDAQMKELIPNDHRTTDDNGPYSRSYRTQEYVVAETNSLAEQLAAML